MNDLIDITIILAVAAIILYIKIDLANFESRAQARKRKEAETSDANALETKKKSGNILDAIALTANYYA